MLTDKQINKIKKQAKKDSLLIFLKQLKEVIVIPFGDRTDKLYLEFFNFVKKVEKEVKHGLVK